MPSSAITYLAATLAAAALVACESDRLGRPDAGGGASIGSGGSGAGTSTGGSGVGGACVSCGEAFEHPFEGPPACAGDKSALDAIRKCACFACFDDCGPLCTEAATPDAGACVACVGKSCGPEAAGCAGL